jgi:hypothetical protein
MMRVPACCVCVCVCVCAQILNCTWRTREPQLALRHLFVHFLIYSCKQFVTLFSRRIFHFQISGSHLRERKKEKKKILLLLNTSVTVFFIKLTNHFQTYTVM